MAMAQRLSSRPGAAEGCCPHIIMPTHLQEAGGWSLPREGMFKSRGGPQLSLPASHPTALTPWHPHRLMGGRRPLSPWGLHGDLPPRLGWELGRPGLDMAAGGGHPLVALWVCCRGVEPLVMPLPRQQKQNSPPGVGPWVLQ